MAIDFHQMIQMLFFTSLNQYNDKRGWNEFEVFLQIIWFLIAIFHYDPYLKLVFSATKIKFTFIIETTINGKQIRKYWMVWNLPKPCNWPNTSSFDFLSKFSTFILVILIIYSLCLVHWQVHQLKMFQYYERQLCYCCRHHAQLKPAQY